MIIQEYLNNETLIKHYSDAGLLIMQVETGAKYGEAIDVVPCRYTYIETDELCEEEDEVLDNDEAIIQSASEVTY